MKSSILALALFASAIGIAQNSKAEFGRRGGFRDSDHREYNNHDYDRDNHRDYDRDYDRGDRREYNWDSHYWGHHHFGYWHNHRGYWTYRGGEHIFINVD